jgi:hypothetical protein
VTVAGAYSRSDWRVVDYQLYRLDPPIIDPVTGAPLELRGPRPAALTPGDYFVCIGGAQTFGRFCARPYSALLADRLGLPAVNLGRGGAGPSFFSPRNQALLYHVNRARFTIVQVMSGRSAGSSLFSSAGLGSYTRVADGTVVGCDEAFQELLRSQPIDHVRRIVAETRQQWLASFRELLLAIEVPKILLWFSVRSPRYRERYGSVSALFGDFPQLVNTRMMSELRRYCDHYVACVSRRGLPQPLVDRTSGERIAVRDEWSGVWRENTYYPSPEMHVDAADALEPACRSLIAGPGGSGPGRARTVLGRVLRRARLSLGRWPARVHGLRSSR